MTAVAPGQEGQSFPCNNCGAKLLYDASVQSLKCPYCGHAQAIQQAQGPAAAVREIPIEEGMRLAQRGLGAPVTAIECKDCGATVNVGQGEQTAKCAFCGSPQVLAREASGNIIRPESLVPFRMDKAAANKKFEEWLGSLWFRPNDLKKMAKVQEMGGVYIPFWTFDSLVHSNWTADAGYYYYETEYYTDANGNQQSRQVQRTRWEPAWGNRTDFFDDVLVCASRGLPKALVTKFTTFQTAELVPYQPHFLSGWRAESYAVELMNAWPDAQGTMGNVQQGRCARDVPGDTHRNLSVNNNFTRVTFKHVLLPIWIAAYRYHGKPFQFLVNGQTGEVVGKAPWSFWKIFFLCLVIAALVGAAIFWKSQSEAPRPPRTTVSAPVVHTPAVATTPAPAPTTTTPKPTSTLKSPAPKPATKAPAPKTTTGIQIAPKK
jgi:DNA-directed RNA polymerase subunit RPC12/RpoP